MVGRASQRTKLPTLGVIEYEDDEQKCLISGPLSAYAALAKISI